MSSVIKASDSNLSVQCVAFNFDDMSRQAEGYLNKIRQEAAKILADAQQETQKIRQQAEKEGLQAAQQKMDQILGNKVGEEMKTLKPALLKVIEEIQHAKQGWLAHWENSVVRLAAAIAGRVIRGELTRQPEIPLRLIREGLEYAAGSSKIRVRMNPEDLQNLRDQVNTLCADLTGLGETTFLPDPEVSRGGCRLETEFGIVDQRFEAQLQRVEEELM